MKQLIKLYIQGVMVCLKDLIFFVRHSNVSLSNNSEAKLMSTLIASYHIIEKGLSMPNRRLGFGSEVMKGLILKCSTYAARYGDGSDQFQYAIGIIREYDNLHKKSHYPLSDSLQQDIDKILSAYDFPAAQQMEMSRETFFAQANASFEQFSMSRHSTRHFDGSVSAELLMKAMDLARHAPSACNKQIVKAYVVTNPTKTKEILDLQEGNRGFGHLIDKVVVITTRYCGCTRYSDRFYPFVDAGIYSMNLLYALHYYQVGAIPLVWLSTEERDKTLRRMIAAADDEMPCLVVGVGAVAEHVVCASSPRKNLSETVIVV